MSLTEEPPVSRPEDVVPARRSDRQSWYWLLVLPIVVPLLVPVYNRTDPTLLGFPFFYWVQLAFIALGVGTTTLVYLKTRDR